MRLLNGATDNVTGDAFPLPMNRANESFFTVYAWGTFDSGSIAIQASPDGGTTWVPVNDEAGDVIALTAAGYSNFKIRATHIRAVLSSVAAAGADLNCAVL